MLLEHLLIQLKISLHETEVLKEPDWILAFSGGADSMLCLSFLLCYAEHFQLKQKKLYLYYLDHKLNYSKDEQKNRETLFAKVDKRLTENKNIEHVWYIKSKDVTKITKKYKKGLEHTSSRIRRKYLDLFRARHNNHITFFGHSLSDWYETVIMRLTRGTSLESIMPFNFFETMGKFNECRPISRITRDEVRNILKNHNIDYWDDPENKNIRHLRNKIRTEAKNINAEGLRKTQRNFFNFSKEADKKNNSLFLNTKAVFFQSREYRVPFINFSKLDIEEKEKILMRYLKMLGLYAFSSSMRQNLKKIPFYSAPYSVEIENWENNLFLVIRRGRQKLSLTSIGIPVGENFQQETDKLTKKYFITLSFGRKSVKKILSEKKLSKRQRTNLPVEMSEENPEEVVFIPLSLYGLKDINSVNDLRGKK